MTVWQYLDMLTPLRRARIIWRKVSKLVQKYGSDNSMTDIEQIEATERDLAEWMQSSAKEAFGLTWL